ncbi:unnamed protein product [Bursaphelenchus xylophilus]|uniref:(pine wood nematode) hypothetical protein n=1 Tax=Bursaphelenchus xylophilus TaxID=6326 RepID=A0A7I8WHR5_BURXY|nr:unnamed protein product [Bursaphelenchus xylophilus]CAG9109531.1 unnamed protein product [Bursaphelenchus xylophilus]
MPTDLDGSLEQDVRGNANDRNGGMRRQSTVVTKDDDSELSECECQTRQYPPWTGEIHGMSQALLSKSRKLRAFWWLVLFVCTSCGTATTVLVVIEYLQGPTATSTTIRLVSSLQLPAITVCPKVPDALDFDGLFDDMRTLMPEISNQTALDVVRFWLAGSGLENIDAINDYNRTYLDELSTVFNRWSEGYDPKSFFELMQTKHGYTCDELFYYCELGGKAKNCCTDMFRKRAVMRRGLCFQTLPNVNQTEADDIGRLVLLMKSPKSIISPQYNYTQPQIIIYVNDNFDYVLDFPRFYLYPNEWNRMHFTARLVELLEHPSDCTSEIEGKDTACFVRNWLTSNVVDQYNCTLPYLTDIPNVPPRNVCDPVVVVREYFHTIQLVHSGSVHSQECVPGCKRWEYGVSLQQSQALDNFTGFKFNLEASFYDLQYEHVKEVYTTSVPGFMSQIGGQFGFFLGLSIITMIQIGIYLISYVFNFFYKLFKQSPEDENEDNQDPTMTDYNGAIPSNGHVRTNGLQMVDGVLYSNRVRPVANGHMMSSWM